MVIDLSNYHSILIGLHKIKGDYRITEQNIQPKYQLLNRKPYDSIFSDRLKATIKQSIRSLRTLKINLITRKNEGNSNAYRFFVMLLHSEASKALHLKSVLVIIEFANPTKSRPQPYQSSLSAETQFTEGSKYEETSNQEHAPLVEIHLSIRIDRL